MKLQKRILFYTSLNLMLVGACIAGPPTVRPAFATPAARLSGRKHFPITKKDPQVYRLQVLSLGAPSGTRTQGPLIKSQLLYQLS